MILNKTRSSRNRYRVLPGSQGCFLDPPGFATYFFMVVAGADRGHGYQAYMSLISVFEEKWVPPEAKTNLRRFLKTQGYDPNTLHKLYDGKPRGYDHPRVQAWERYVYSYFWDSYSPDGQSRNVSGAKHDGPDEWHLGYMKVKKHYPEAKPRPELFKSRAYGREGTWWETLEDRPTPETCPGSKSLRQKHPVNHSWCQVCGWREEEERE